MAGEVTVVTNVMIREQRADAERLIGRPMPLLSGSPHPWNIRHDRVDGDVIRTLLTAGWCRVKGATAD